MVSSESDDYADESCEHCDTEIQRLGAENRKLKKRIIELENENNTFKEREHERAIQEMEQRPQRSLDGALKLSISPSRINRLRRTLNPPPSNRNKDLLVQSMVDELRNKLGYHIKKVSPSTYTLGTSSKHYILAVHSGRLVVRIGCGYEDIISFLDRRSKVTART